MAAHELQPKGGMKARCTGDNETDIEEEMRTLWIALLLLFSGAKPSEGAGVFTIVNECKTTIWPGIIPGDSFNGGGFALKQGQSVVFKAPVGWSGRIWGRTGCNFDRNGNGSCQTGRCGSSLKCSGSGETPATLAEFTLTALNFYDVSLVDGFNLPVVVTPVNAQGGNCSSAGCDGDLRRTCPSELAVRVDRETVACRSAKNRVCSYHDNRLTCSGTEGGASARKWLMATVLGLWGLLPLVLL
ncbi:hypothetical protein MUK42_16227 [Musa troglodytarum]|uniref:Thaumatin-like protein n=1 Tax=Musa troglodytarum TaxID=320322 RepID=A0A9E7H392_9LILI|nr:hypothetical protein MUK42_16227 [Musa troglodytarum]